MTTIWTKHDWVQLVRSSIWSLKDVFLVKLFNWNSHSLEVLSCWSTRLTISREWKLFSFYKMEVNYYHGYHLYHNLQFKVIIKNGKTPNIIVTWRLNGSFLSVVSHSSETLSHCWFNVGPPSTTLAQRWTNNGSMGRVCVSLTCQHKTNTTLSSKPKNIPVQHNWHYSLSNNGKIFSKHSDIGPTLLQQLWRNIICCIACSYLCCIN